MSLDASIIGEADASVTVRVDPAQLGAFADSIGETRAEYRDSNAARRAGYPDIPVPPTYHFSLGREQSDLLGLLERRGVDLLRLLHGEQSFRYDGTAFAGDALRVERRISDYFEKGNPVLRFIVMQTDIRSKCGSPVSSGRETLILMPDQEFKSHKACAPDPDVPPGSERLEELRPGMITRNMLATFARASGDLNPVHLERDAARKSGHEDVFAHGMLSMAWLGRMLTDRVPQEAIREFAVRFRALTPLGMEPVCNGFLSSDGARAALSTRLATGPLTLSGTALLRDPSRPPG